MQISDNTSYTAYLNKEVVTTGVKNVGYNNAKLGFNVYNKTQRMNYGSNHFVENQEKLAMNYEQDGNKELIAKNAKDIMPSNLEFRKTKIRIRKGLTNKSMLENISRSCLENGRGQIRGFEEPEEDIVKTLYKDEVVLDTDKFGYFKKGFGQAGHDETILVKEAVNSERIIDKEEAKKDEAKARVENEIPAIKTDINEIKNF